MCALRSRVVGSGAAPEFLALPPVPERGSREVRPGADAQHRALRARSLGQFDGAQHAETGCGVLGEHCAVAFVGFDDDPGGATVLEAPAHDACQHRGGEAVLGRAVRRRDEEVHAEIAGFRMQHPGGQQSGGIIGLDVDERDPVPQADPAVLVLGGGDGVEVGAHLCGRMVDHAPETGARGAQPAVQQAGVVRRTERFDAQVQRVVRVHQVHGDAPGQRAAGRPKVWKAMRRSIGYGSRPVSAARITEARKVPKPRSGAVTPWVCSSPPSTWIRSSRSTV